MREDWMTKLEAATARHEREVAKQAKQIETLQQQQYRVMEQNKRVCEINVKLGRKIERLKNLLREAVDGGNATCLYDLDAWNDRVRIALR